MNTTTTPAQAAATGRPAALLAAFALALTACGSTATSVSLCSAPSESCPCPDAEPGDAAVVLLTDRASSAFTAAAQRLAADGIEMGDISVLGIEDAQAPLVVMATYDALGEVHEQAAISLAGVGASPLRAEADAKLRAACLREAVATVPADGQPGDLIRALPRAMEVALARSPDAAILAFGLGRSSLDGQRLAEIDLDTPDARSHVISELTRVGLVGRTMPVTVTFVDPMEGVEDVTAANAINAFASHNLCRSIAADGDCDSVLVLP